MSEADQSAPPAESRRVDEFTPVPVQEERASFGAPPEETVIQQPIGLYYAFLAGGALTTLGLLGLVPQFTQGGVLFDVMRVTTPTTFLHLFTGLAGIGVAFLRKRRFATAYAAIIGAIYLVTFSNGNVDYGNIEASLGVASVLTRIQWITYNGLHAGLMLASWLVAALSAMQKGDRATRAYRGERRWFLESRTRTEA